MPVNQIQLRSLRRNDSALLYKWINDRKLVLFNAPFRPISQLDHEAWIESMLVKRNDLVLFVIEEIKTQHAIGTCQLMNISWIHRKAELQIRIGETDFHGKGLGTETIKFLCHFGFKDMNMHRIYLHVFATNKRALRTYEKCDFKREGLLKDAAYINGQFVDIVCMGLLRGQT